MTMLSIVIPAYNEEDGIAEIAARVLEATPALAEAGIDQLELLIVDDGSADNTVSIVKDLAAQCANVRCIVHPVNRGYGAALKTGFNAAEGQLLGFLDADGTYPPEYFPALCQEALKGADLVIGSRMTGSESQMPITRRIGNVFFAALLTTLSGQRVTDSASGMRVFHQALLPRIYPLPDGLNLTPVMSTRALHEGLEIVEVPIPYSERVGRSKLSVVRDGSVFLQSMIWTAMMYNPVRILGIIGLISVGLSLMILLGILMMRLQGVTTLGALGVAAIFVAAVAGFAGFSIFALGISFNYLVSLFYMEPIRQGLFGRPIFSVPIERHFWWIGGTSLVMGLMLGIVSLYLGLRGWEISRTWFYMLGSAMLILTGLQLLVYWIQLRVLEELSERDIMVKQELLTAKEFSR